MPIFHDIVERPPSRSRRSPEVTGGGSHERFQVESGWSSLHGGHMPSQARSTISTEEEERPLSRGELIDRIKRGSSPTWSFKHGFGRRTPDQQQSPRHSPRPASRASLLPSAELRESPKSPSSEENGWSNQAAGMEIERPRSALHSGDFRDNKSEAKGVDNHAEALATSPVAPWHNDFPSFLAARAPERHQQRKQRITSQSSLSQFVLMPPTSPLVQATYNSDLDEPTSHPVSQRRSRSPHKESRRHTFSPQSLQAYGSAIFGSHPSTPRPVPGMRRESTFPYQAHQPRRSITSLNHLSHSISSSTPHTPLLRPRGLSTASDSSPLHHAPMVGSYEESILQGRMSTTPSRPLNFVAQIGVLGKGKCKSSLRCPPHAIVPFPAVFYSYGSGAGRITDNSPSPYVGLIDIENNIPTPKETRDESRRRRRYASPASTVDRDSSVAPAQMVENASEINGSALRRKRDRLRKRSQSPKAPPSGSYRIPQQGQLQIIIKNPNKTAVKLFLVPYDLSDMEPGQKTFIRQRSYSAGPIIDMPLSARTNFGTDRPEASLSNSEDPRDRPVLRYLIHLHICCTAKGRYYLYKSIRVVFANRVPDGKEKLRNEIQLPEPKYSAYKPSRDVTPSHQNPATFALSSAKSLAEERAARRRSTPLNFGGQMSLDAADGMDDWTLPASRSVKAIPFMLNGLETVDSRPSSRDQSSIEAGNPFLQRLQSPRQMSLSDEDMGLSPTSGGLAMPTRSGRNDPNSAWQERRANPLLAPQHTSTSFSLSKGASPSQLPNKSSEGLLARQLRGLSVERERHEELGK